MSNITIRLEPVSHQELGEIVVGPGLFSIGRMERPFVNLPEAQRARLSRRHARIFQEEGQAYIIDLGSSNGSRLNGQPLGTGCATELSNGDSIQLAGDFTYKVALQASASDAEPSGFSESKLILYPVDSSSGLEPIAITQFPFLVSRSASAFGEYSVRFPTDVGQISRRHAVIAIRDDGFYIEDLASKNGTFVSGTRLEEQSYKLSNGETLAFGGDKFVYKVGLLSADTAIEATGALGPIEVEEAVGLDPEVADRTMFVNSATSFLEIFCDDDDDQLSPDKLQEQVDGERAQGVTPQATKRVSAGRSIASELGQVLSGGEVMRPGVFRGLVAGVVLLLLVVGGVYLYGSDKDNIKKYFAQGDYMESAQLANSYLDKHPEDTEVESLAVEAVLKAVVPPWVEHINGERFDEASSLLDDIKRRLPSLVRAQEMIEVLLWSSNLRQYVVNRGGTRAPIVIFQDEKQIALLIQDWDAASVRHQQLVSQIAVNVPEFETIQLRTFSDLRQLRNDSALYGKAIDKLVNAISFIISAKSTEDIEPLVSDFEKNYPRVTGLTELKADVSLYKLLLQSLKNINLSALVTLSKEFSFNTDLFRKNTQHWLQKELLPSAVVSQYDQAMAHWRKGDTDSSTEALESLNATAWTALASQQIDRMHAIDAEYTALRHSAQSADYSARLLAFRTKLELPQDSHFLTATEADFLEHRDKLLVGLKELQVRAQSYWAEFQGEGGITGVDRVEEHISDKFKQQASRLSSAYREVIDGSNSYRQLQLTPSQVWQDLDKNVRNETRRQRRWLRDLEVVLDPVLLQEKLKLLPQIEE